MGDQDELNALDVSGEWIWGNDLEMIVYAQAYGQGQTLIFRFTINPEAKSSLATRIVNCYHDRTVDNEFHTFPDRPSMRSPLWLAVATVWVECSECVDIADLDVIIDVYDFKPGELPKVQWALFQDPLFNDYVELLSSPGQLSFGKSVSTVDLKDLVRLQQLGGRGSHIYVQIDFRTFLFDYESGHIKEDIQYYYKSLNLLANMPPHPNIMKPAQILVTVSRSGDDRPIVCGSLYPFLQNGTFASHIQMNKAQWCYEMASAIAHTHLVAHTYHMDIKPGNFRLDDNNNLVLIDWEQNDALVTTAAPEVDGTWDVEQTGEGETSTLQYKEYSGPKRRNMPLTTPGDKGWNTWNVFLEWSKSCPIALELAEVFSLGPSMWMLLEQTDMEVFDDVENAEEVVVNWKSSDDISESWKETVRKCLQVDPNDRIGSTELVAFWDCERRKLRSGQVLGGQEKLLD
ncbi:hypothetical protein HYFRA_00006317 [Hymenoscyphus fraxineus]|uniref:Protein kinase domain-containing protein n=1 Tax=Hymenoscyphus fraxineus TaxID=746836 RepID=A0A9N9PPA6_9HELO|nr:hypothetical protein HYFRA_00006317 [Hymenoscyphus fraxineus]